MEPHKSQPTPFMYNEGGFLMDSCGRPVDFSNKHNLKAISNLFCSLDSEPELRLIIEEKDEEIKNLEKQIENLEQTVNFLSV